MRGSGLLKSNSTKKDKKRNDKSKSHWVLKIFFITFIISIIFSIVSQKTFSSSGNFLLPLSIIFIIILIGVIFDIVGIAVASTPETPFLSMSSKKIKGAKQALNLIKNADIVSNFCNDVVGDICGIVSGAAGSMLVLKMVRVGFSPDVLTILISSLIAAITVAGKALGKSLAINRGQQIVYSVGYLLSFFSENSTSKNKNNGITKRKETK
jgi:heme/copper-type cytochrome/quinol oxidase subunit 4